MFFQQTFFAKKVHERAKSEKTNKDLQEQIGRLFDEAELIQNVEQEAAKTAVVVSSGTTFFIY